MCMWCYKVIQYGRSVRRERDGLTLRVSGRVANAAKSLRQCPALWIDTSYVRLSLTLQQREQSGGTLREI